MLIIDDISTARDLGEALIAGGLPVLEVTLRTECALDAIVNVKIKGGNCRGWNAFNEYRC